MILYIISFQRLLISQEYDYSVDIWSLSCMLLGIVFNRTPFFRGKDNYEQLRKIEEVLGNEDLDNYIEKYHLKLNKETKALLGQFKRRQWSEFVNQSTEKFINDDLFDYLDKTLVYDHAVSEQNKRDKVQERLTAKEAMAHKWFDPVRDDILHENDKKRSIPLTTANSEKKAKICQFLVFVCYRILTC